MVTFLKNRISITLLVFVCFTIGSCFPNKEHNRFKFAKNIQGIQRPTLLRTDGVYIDKFKGKDTCIFNFIRFYENGRCFSSKGFIGEPDNDTFDNTKKENGQRTYFKNKKNSVIIEVWANYYTGYCFEYGIVDSTKLIITSSRARGLFSQEDRYPKPIIYEFKKVELTGTADW